MTLLIHVAVVVLCLWRLGLPSDSSMRAAAQLVSVTLVAAAPSNPAPDLPLPKPPPMPEQRLVEPPPVQPATPALPPLPVPVRPPPDAVSVAVAEAPPPPPPPEPARPQVSAQAAPAVPPAPQAAAPTEAAPNSLTRTAGQANWESQVLAHLERNKRYPAAARLRRQEDVIYVRFVVDRQGQVSNVRIVRSQGFPLLEEEVHNLLRRAAPLPPVPPDIHGDSVELLVPVEFFMRGR